MFTAEEGSAAFHIARQNVHARRPDEVSDEGVRRPLEQLDRGADLHDFTVLHHHDLVGERQRFGLIVSHVDHGRLHPLVQFLQLGAQLPLQVRIDHSERLVKHHDVDVLAHQTAAHGDLLLVVGRQVRRTSVQHVGDFKHLGNRGDTLLDDVLVAAPVAQREGEIVVNGHRVVDDRKLEHLRDVALCRRQRCHVLIVEQDLTFRGNEQAGDDVEKRGLAAAGRPKKRIGSAVFPRQVDLLQSIVSITLWIGVIAVTQI